MAPLQQSWKTLHRIAQLGAHWWDRPRKFLRPTAVITLPAPEKGVRLPRPPCPPPLRSGAPTAHKCVLPELGSPATPVPMIGDYLHNDIVGNNGPPMMEDSRSPAKTNPNKNKQVNNSSCFPQVDHPQFNSHGDKYSLSTDNFSSLHGRK